jgi:two-component system, NtrC family, sensor kinase
MASNDRSPTEGSPDRGLLISTLGRLLLLYFAPLLLLAVFLNLQYRHLAEEARQLHLKAVAEHLASTLDLFIRERRVNLTNVLDDPLFPSVPEATFLGEKLKGLRQTSGAFVDLGVFDALGRQVAYFGPHPSLQSRNYAGEDWFVSLEKGEDRHIITDIYLGFRGLPHFTIAVKTPAGEEYRVLRAALSPEGIFEYIAPLEGSSDVHIGLVNAEGRFQVVTPSLGQPLSASPFRPPRAPAVGIVPDSPTGPAYAYTWLSAAPWALIAVSAGKATTGALFAGAQGTILAFTLGFFLIEGAVIWVRTKQVVRQRRQAKRTEAELAGQLVHASKLAAVGELAAGIAHEINNPLAIIAEEAGLVKDLMDPSLGGSPASANLGPHLDTIHKAVFRCRDITRKLLGFVRQTDLRLEPTNVNEITDGVVEGLLGPNLAVSKIEVVKDFCPGVWPVLADRSQLEQVLLNLINNAIDAMQGRGRLTLRTICRGDTVAVSVADTGHGIDPADVDRIFTPFYTTKDPGKGTGLGLSISYSIIKSLGGRLYVNSAPGRGATFTVELPAETGQVSGTVRCQE